MVVDRPRAGTESDLEDGVEVKENHDSNQKAQREGIMGHSLMWLVESVGFRELGLMVHKAFLLQRAQDSKFQVLFVSPLVPQVFKIDICLP